MDDIRIGMINCDLHAMYYAGLMGGYDAVQLRDDPVGRGHAAYFYFHLQYNDPRQITVPVVDGLRITRVWDADRATAANMARLFNPDAVVCDAVEEASDDVDLVFIADCNGDGSDHLELATPGLRKGVPTFVDKPLAFASVDAKRIMDTAHEAGAPVMSCSMLGWTPQTLQFRDRFAELGGPQFGTVKGGGESMAGHIHAITFALTLFGYGVESVECMGQTPLAHVHLDYGGRAQRPAAGVVLNCASGATYHCAMYASAFSGQGAIHSRPIGDFEFPWGAARILELVKQMVATGDAPIADAQMLEWIAVATAARLSQGEHRRVFLSEVTGGSGP